MGALRAKFDVIMWPHGGAVGQGNRRAVRRSVQRTAEYPSLGFPTARPTRAADR